MHDHFAALDLPRRPWLDSAAVKDRFHTLSATLHPDVPGSGDGPRFVALNTAHTILRDPAARVRHLLELEAPQLAIASDPTAALGELFMRQASLLQRASAFLRKRAAIGNPLGRALLAGDGAALQREAGDVMAELEASNRRALEELRDLDARWTGADRQLLEMLAPVQQQLAFIGKWRAQLQETIFQLGV